MTQKTAKINNSHELSSLCFNSCSEWKLSSKMSKANTNTKNIVSYYVIL